FAQRTLLWLLLAVMLTACDQPPFADQPKYEPYEAAWDWPDDQSALQPVPGTVSRDAMLGPIAQTLPVPLTQELLARGQQRYRIYCTPCHGQVGYGNGLVVQHGFPAPPSYHTERLRNASLRHFYDVISDGYGVMYSYAARVAPGDRWAIAAYIRALQLSQHAPVRILTPQQRAKLEDRQ
ncbi:MAG: cytochrome c, partial [Nitrococcus sp.]|nr:cytochrome c [Nitrococcus sp.]